MARRPRAALIVFGALLALGRSAAAQQPPAPATPAAEEQPTGAPGAASEKPAAAPVDLGEELPQTRPADLSYGVAARLVWVSVPSWLLNLFTKNNVPLSSWGTGISVFRRHGNFDLALSFNYQNMSPPDGNWLGSSADPTKDVNFVHFDNFALYGIDLSFIWHAFFNDWFGLHYGAGFGIGILGGHIIRAYARNGQCTAQNVSDTSVCAPDYTDPTQQPFYSGSIPAAVPIFNAVFGLDFRLPNVRGWEARIEGGFYDAFFLGGGVGYTF
jgi:hypothetical protein